MSTCSQLIWCTFSRCLNSGEFVNALPEFCVVGKVEAVPHDVQQQMGDTHDEIIVLVRPVAGEQLVGDGGARRPSTASSLVPK